jgi:two-component system invasion response regulator UvrY
MRVLMAEPHPLVLKGMEWQLSRAFSGCVMVACDRGSGNEALRRLLTEPWDLFVTEIMLPLRDGLDVIQRVRRQDRQTPVLVLTALDGRVYGPLALRAGATGFVEKSADTDELLRALLRVAVGRRYLSETLLEHLEVTSHQGCLPDPHLQLTEREREISLQIASGRSVACIASDLCVACKTIYSHRANILRKLGVRTDNELGRYAFEHGLIQCRRLSEGAAKAGPL